MDGQPMETIHVGHVGGIAISPKNGMTITARNYGPGADMFCSLHKAFSLSSEAKEALGENLAII